MPLSASQSHPAFSLLLTSIIPNLPHPLRPPTKAPTNHHLPGSPVPVWDISPHYTPEDRRDLLVRNTRLGGSLASAFSTDHAVTTLANIDPSLSSPSAIDPNAHPLPSHTTLLMRGHGFTTASASVRGAVFQAVYTAAAARTQTSALLIQNAFNIGDMIGRGAVWGQSKKAARSGWGDEEEEDSGLLYLNEDEREGTWTMNKDTVGRPWGLWVREVRTHGLYRNEEVAQTEDPDFVRV